jgi:hypothetical protein
MKKSGFRKQLSISEKEHMLRWKKERVTQKKIVKRQNILESIVYYVLKRIYIYE